jgi:hypothetical protein
MQKTTAERLKRSNCPNERTLAKWWNGSNPFSQHHDGYAATYRLGRRTPWQVENAIEERIIPRKLVDIVMFREIYRHFPYQAVCFNPTRTYPQFSLSVLVLLVFHHSAY